MGDRVRWTASTLNGGTHTVTYKALAVTTGTFSHPPARAWLSDMPETMGMSGGQQTAVSSTPQTRQAGEQDTLISNLGLIKSAILSAATECVPACDAGADEICNARTGVCFRPEIAMASKRAASVPNCVLGKKVKKGAKLKKKKLLNCSDCHDLCTNTSGCVGYSFKVPKKMGKKSRCQLYSTVVSVTKSKKYSSGGTALS